MRGFILHPTYRIVCDRPEVRLYGTLENSDSFCVIDDRTRPYFFVSTSHAAEAAAHGAVVEPTDLSSPGGEPVARVSVAVPSQVPELRSRLTQRGVPCYEADLRFTSRYLIDRQLRAAIAIKGSFEPGEGIARVYRNPVIEPARFTPRLKILSIDIETDMRATTLFALALAGLGSDRVLIVGPGPLAGAECFPTERALLLRFFTLLRELDPDVITGWNVVDFDLTVLRRLCAKHRIPFRLGRTADETTIRRDPSFTREARASATGRQVLDALALTRGAFIRLEDYKLETAARTFLGRGKLMSGDGRGYEIQHAFHHNRQKLVDYNLLDAQLVLDILAKQSLIDLAISRSLLTGMQLDRLGASIAAVDLLYLGALRRRGYVAPSVPADRTGMPVAGGAVLDSVPGLFRNILVFDFKSLYPSIIRTFNIDPFSHVPPGREATATDLIRTPNGTAFSRVPAILPELVTRLWQERDAARAGGDLLAANAIKILMNSLYGVLAAPSCRFFSPTLANAITQTGQHLIHLTSDEVRQHGYAVIYGDTDSLFIDPDEPDHGRALRRAEKIRTGIAALLVRRLRENFGVESFLELEFAKCYERFFMPEVRRGIGGSKKRYAGLLTDSEGKRVEFVGLEAVRRDWTPVARRFQRELLERVFYDRPVEDFIRSFLAELHAGRLDGLLTYKKAVRKDLAAYTKTTPAHVKAARRQRGPAPRIVEYVMTTAGPEPVEAQYGRLDYQHYVEKQIKPIADQVLRFIGTSFDHVLGRPRQLDLL